MCLPRHSTLTQNKAALRGKAHRSIDPVKQGTLSHSPTEETLLISASFLPLPSVKLTRNARDKLFLCLSSALPITWSNEGTISDSCPHMVIS
ncbi:hypothetical protein Naga_100463g3 [Nannochloropsis gaditana]|uniref:Uncharacterized protein n=1 Tax=Nannochloropsis gaditana TaxID=72520 RepID=W7THK6_9STRA|nr:hypothetical protein Naga_100463g3 [Nannochloropsis gaditana]